VQQELQHTATALQHAATAPLSHEEAAVPPHAPPQTAHTSPPQHIAIVQQALQHTATMQQTAHTPLPLAHAPREVLIVTPYYSTLLHITPHMNESWHTYGSVMTHT